MNSNNNNLRQLLFLSWGSMFNFLLLQHSTINKSKLAKESFTKTWMYGFKRLPFPERKENKNNHIVEDKPNSIVYCLILRTITV